VIGTKKLPLEELLGYVGVDYTRVKMVHTFSFGQCELGYDPVTMRMRVSGTANMNDFGKKMGYRIGDEIDKINGKQLTARGFWKFRQDWVNTVKEGDKLRVTVLRPGPDGKQQKKTLKAKVTKSDVKTYNSIAFNPAPSDEQLKLRNVWLYGIK